MALNLRAKIDSQLQIARKLIALDAANNPAGDCDSDGVIEPTAPDTSAGCTTHPAGGGCVPTTVGAAKTDPWGTLVGYCAWDQGPVHAGCNGLLQGEAPGNNKTIIAVISAGPDRQFQTTCGDSPAYVTKGGDDIVEEWTLDEAQALAGGGLWTLVSGSPNQIAPVKDIGNATFASGTTASFKGNADFGAGSQLNLASGGLFVLPDQTNSGPCSAANNAMLRVDTTTGRVLQICDPTASPLPAWINIGGSTSVTKIDDLIDAVSDFTTGANVFLGNGGGVSIAGATKNVGVGIGAGAGVTSGTGNVLLGWEHAAAPFGEPGTFRSVADIDSPEASTKVRQYKQQVKAEARSRASTPG
jgi:hypothetical protein